VARAEVELRGEAVKLSDTRCRRDVLASKRAAHKEAAWEDDTIPRPQALDFDSGLFA
jgi:hypothetical protein